MKPRFKLTPVKPVEPLEPSSDLLLEDYSGKSLSIPVLDFEVSITKRYMVAIDIGGMPPREAYAYLEKFQTQLTEFFAPGKVMVTHSRNGIPGTTIYELDQIEDELTSYELSGRND